jgi:hypothetical protein
MRESRDEPTPDVAACADNQDAHNGSMGRTGDRLWRPALPVPAQVTLRNAERTTQCDAGGIVGSLRDSATKRSAALDRRRSALATDDCREGRHGAVLVSAALRPQSGKRRTSSDVQ